MYKSESADFISKLLHGVTAAHMLHLMAKGPGSYAAHKALGALYEGLEEQADSLAEECMGVHGIIESFPSEKFTISKWLSSMSLRQPCISHEPYDIESVDPSDVTLFRTG